jgi:beta-lactamase regulating signal transducer with metallopeptidase domain
MLAVVKDFIQPFSFLRNIVISEKDYTENKEMVITHEYAHIRHFHAVDLVICELFTALHWFNPFVWLLRRDLKLIHEYQADQAVLNKGIDAAKYQLLVIEKAVGERRFAMANHFTQKPILKRIK